MIDASIFTLLLRLVVSLAVVIALMAFLAAALRKRGVMLGGAGAGAGPRRRASAAVQVELIARRALGRNAQVAVVRTAGRTLVLGVTEHQVTMLLDTEIDDDVDGLEVLPEGVPGTGFPGAVGGPHSGSAWKTMLDTIRDRTVRR